MPIDALSQQDFHNLFVLLALVLIGAWLGKVVLQVIKTLDILHRLSMSQSLQLEGMSLYASDFQQLIRQHFNQVLRIRRTVPPKLVPRYALSAHLDPDSIAQCSGEESDGSKGSGPLGFGVQFTVDSLVPCSVKLFWGVSVQACNDFAQRHQASGWPTNEGRTARTSRGADKDSASPGTGISRVRRWARPAASGESSRSLLEAEELGGSGGPLSGGGRVASSGEDGPADIFQSGDYMVQSRDVFLPAGMGQRYLTPAGDLIDPAQLHFDVTAPWLREGGLAPNDGSVVPLAVVITAQRRPSGETGQVQDRPVIEARGQVSLIRFRRTGIEDGAGLRSGVPEVVRQICFGDPPLGAYEVQGIYGFEEGEADSADCMICCARAKNVLLLPCRHCSVCHYCLRSLRDEKCPLCRATFSSYVTLPLLRAHPEAQVITPAPPEGEQSDEDEAIHRPSSRWNDLEDGRGEVEMREVPVHTGGGGSAWMRLSD